jgi:hypothetical protein
VSTPGSSSDWRWLFRIACALIRQVNSKQSIIDHWTLGASPTIDTHIGDERALLETVREVILKKVYYRGRSLKPRDIFDIAVAAENHSESLIKELRGYRGEVSRALAGLDVLNVDFVDQAISELVIRDRYQEIAKAALERSKEILRAV